MEITLNPMTGNKIEYIWASHRKPWRMSCGRIGRARIEDGYIKVGFTISLREARSHHRWDKKNKRILIEVLDNDGRVVIDNWLEFGKRKAITATLCLGESNA